MYWTYTDTDCQSVWSKRKKKKTYQWQCSATHDDRGEETSGRETREEPWQEHTPRTIPTPVSQKRKRISTVVVTKISNEQCLTNYQSDNQSIGYTKKRKERIEEQVKNDKVENF